MSLPNTDDMASPDAVVVEQSGQTRRLPIINLTRIAQLTFVASVLAVWCTARYI